MIYTLQSPSRLRLIRSIAASSLALVIACSWGATSSWAEPLSIINPSFESDTVPLGPPYVKMGAPDGWTGVEAGGQIGVFYNPPPGSVGQTGEDNHIDNADGNQAVFMNSAIGVSFYQELSRVYQAGQTYSISMLAEGGNGMLDGAKLEIRLYYVKEGVRTSVVTGEAIYEAKSGEITHLNTYSATRLVQPGDEWIGQTIGVEVVNTSTGGGYWDIDDIQANVTSVPEPATGLLLLVGIGAQAFRRRRGSAI